MNSMPSLFHASQFAFLLVNIVQRLPAGHARAVVATDTVNTINTIVAASAIGTAGTWWMSANMSHRKCDNSQWNVDWTDHRSASGNEYGSACRERTLYWISGPARLTIVARVAIFALLAVVAASVAVFVCHVVEKSER